MDTIYFYTSCGPCEFRDSNVLHAARWKYTTQKLRKKSPSAHHRTNLSGYISATKAAWRSGNVVGRINEVTLRGARVLGWVTVVGG